MTNGFKISPVGPPIVNGVVIQYGRPIWLYPDAVLGHARTNLNVGLYQIEVYGFTFQKPIYMPVPNDNATYNATALITNGVASASGMGTSFVSQVIAGSGISLSPANGLGNVTVSSTAIGGVSQITAGTGISLSPSSGLGNVTVSAPSAGVSKIITVSPLSVSPSSGLGNVTLTSSAVTNLEARSIETVGAWKFDSDITAGSGGGNLRDFNGLQSVDWNNRVLYDSGGSTMVDWGAEVGILSIAPCRIGGGTIVVSVLSINAVLDFPNTSPQNSSDLTISLTGCALGDPVILGVPNASVNANTCYTAWVSANNVVTVRFNNYSSGSVNPASGTFRVAVMRF